MRLNVDNMVDVKSYEVIIIGGSFAGLSAAMTLGRSIRSVLVIDDDDACNRSVRHSHNFISHDGERPEAIVKKAKQELMKYATVHFHHGKAISATAIEQGYLVATDTNETFSAAKLLFATGIKDIMPEIAGFKDCWGISIMHCPYCHGYEVRQQSTGILAKGTVGFNFCKMLLQWSEDLTLITNGPAELDEIQRQMLHDRGISIHEEQIDYISHHDGYVDGVVLKGGRKIHLKALFTKAPFEQHCSLPKDLGCEFTPGGLVKVDHHQKTTVEGVFAAGDNSHFFRGLSVAIGAGTIAAATINKELLDFSFETGGKKLVGTISV